MKLASYWLDTALGLTSGAAGPVPARADVVIVGGGFTGLSAALAVAKSGGQVVVLEADRITGEASGRNGGHCNNGSSLDFAGLAERLGLERARAVYRAYDAGVDLVERLVAEERIECGFSRSGKLKLAAKPAHYDKLARSFEILNREVDADTALISAADLGAEIGSSAFHGGVLQRRSASMHVGRFGHGLAEAAIRHGARIYENACVTRLERLSGHRHQVVSERGLVEADQVLIATGASLHGPLGFFRRRIVPVGSFIVVTEPLDPTQVRSIMPGGRTCTTTLNIGNYFRMSESRLVFGGRARFAMSSPTSDAKSGRILEARLLSIFPQLKGARLDYCWGGLVDMTADRLPRAGEHEGLYYAMGYSGHGVQMSVHMGHAMAEVMAGRAEANPWRDFDWPPIPAYTGRPWFLPAVGAYYRLMDWLH